MVKSEAIDQDQWDLVMQQTTSVLFAGTSRHLRKGATVTSTESIRIGPTEIQKNGWLNPKIDLAHENVNGLS